MKKRAVPPLIWPNVAITVARAESILSNKLGVFQPPLEPFDVVNKEYMEGKITVNTYPRSVLFASDPPGSLRGISKFTYNDTIDTVYLDGSLDITSTTGSLNLSGGKITGIGTPTDPNDAATKAYVDSHSYTGSSVSATGPNLSVQYNSGGLFAGSSLFLFNETLGSLSIGSIDIIGGGLSGGTDYSITGLSMPIGPTDAANKAYVDAATGSAPGLPFNSVQFNSAGIFGGSADLTYDGQTFYIANSTPSTGLTNGSLVVSGGIGIGENVYIGGKTRLLDSTASTNVSSGALVVTGGVGVIGSLNVGNSVIFENTLAIMDTTQTSDTSTGALTVSGGVGIAGSLNIGDTIHVYSTEQSTNTSSGALTISGGMGIQKDVFIGGICHADEYLTTSDQRLKKDITKIDSDHVFKLMQLSGYTYYLKDHPDLKYGLMAQEIENAGLEHFVKEVGDHKKVNYQYFIPVLIESIKTLSEKLNNSETKYENLKNSIEELRQKIF